MATTPCTLPTAKAGKHAWKFVRNGQSTTVKHGPNGSTARSKLVGVYACLCGAKRTGTPNHSAPGADLRDHLGALGVRVAGIEATKP